MDNSTTPTSSGVPVNEVVPAPTSSSSSTPAQPEFTAFDKPMDLVTSSSPSLVIDPATGQQTGDLPVNTKFRAVGKYETPHGIYFTDGRLSVKTVDLQPDPNPTIPSGSPQPEANADGQEQKVEVRVVPSTPKSWKDSYQDFIGGPATYMAKSQVVLHDMGGLLPDSEVMKGKKGTLVGKFQKDTVWYYLSKSSKDAQDAQGNGPWYGYPVAIFQRVDDPNDDLLPQDIFDAAEAKASEVAAGYSKKHKVVAAAGTSAGLLNRFRGKK